LREKMPDDARWTTPGGGPTLWLELPRAIPLPALAAALAARQVLIEDTTPAFFGAPHLHGFRISYAYSPIEAVRGGIAAVAEEIARLRR
jgi:DNA-binding transcriptional MocR family regulator